MTKELMAKIKELEEKAGENWIGEFRFVKTKEELVQKVKKYDIDLTDEIADEALSLITDNSENELSETDLKNIAAGATGPPSPIPCSK